MMAEKIAVIGIDGVSWDIVNNIIRRGYWNTIAAILDESSRFNLISTDPPLTLPAWNSIASGVNPGKHGMYSFYRIIKAGDGFISQFYSGWEVCYPRLHEISALYKKSCFVANLPATYYVPEYVNKYCIIVSDWLSPIVKVNREEYSYLREAFSKSIAVKEYKKDIKKISKALSHRTYLISKAIKKTIEEHSFNIVFIVFSELDWIMHKDPEFIAGETIDAYSKVLDSINDVVALFKKKRYKIVFVSDHGFKIYHKIFNPYLYLQEQGVPSGSIEYSWKSRSIIEQKIVSLIKKHVRLKILIKNIMKKIKKEKESRRTIPYNMVKAFLPDPYYVYLAPGINRDDIIELFNKSGYVNALDPNSVYGEGYCISRAPDIVLRSKSDDVFLGRVGKSVFVDNVKIADHHPIGIFSVEDYVNLKSNYVYTWDVAPYIFASIGLPIPEDTDSSLELLEASGLKYRFDKVRSKWLIVKKLSSI